MNHLSRPASLGAAALVVLNPALVWASPMFMGLGFLPGGSLRSAAAAVSADGSVVVGWSSSADSAADDGYDNEAFRWSSTTGMVGLGDLAGGEFASSATAVSADGTVVVGSGAAGTEFEAFRWTQATGLVGLGDLPGGSPRSEAFGVSADGTIVVGYSGSTASLDSGYYEAFRWTESTGIMGLGDLPGGTFASSAAAVSADGSMIVGDSFSIFLESPDGRAEGFQWTQASGMVGLGELAGGELYSTATDVSADGSIVVGQSSSGPFPTYEAVIWDNGGITGLGDLPGGRFISVARAVSGDGSVVVGSADTGAVPAYDNNTAFIWDSLNGMRALQDVLQSEYGLDLSGWWLLDAKDISDDGRTIVGVGINPSGDTEAWIAVIPEPATGTLLSFSLALLSLTRRCRSRAR